MNYTISKEMMSPIIGEGKWKPYEGAYKYYPPYPECYPYYVNYNPISKIDPEQFDQIINLLKMLNGEPDEEKTKLEERVEELEGQLEKIRETLDI